MPADAPAIRAAAEAEQPGADVGPDHGTDLGDEDRLGAEHLAALVDQAAGGVGIVDVLDDPCARARLPALACELDHALEGAPPGPARRPGQHTARTPLPAPVTIAIFLTALIPAFPPNS